MAQSLAGARVMQGLGPDEINRVISGSSERVLLIVHGSSGFPAELAQWLDKQRQQGRSSGDIVIMVSSEFAKGITVEPFDQDKELLVFQGGALKSRVKGSDVLVRLQDFWLERGEKI